MIEYIDEVHLYLYNGVIIPSVSQILKEKIFPDKYKGVPENILRAKAEYGRKVHSIIEKIEKEEQYVIGNEYIKESIDEYFELKEIYNIKVLEQEKIVCYNGLYAGRFDMIAKINGKRCLCDIKTTEKLDEEYLSWQLSMYELAYGEEFDELYAIWLPKRNLARLIKIERKEKSEIEKLFKE